MNNTLTKFFTKTKQSNKKQPDMQVKNRKRQPNSTSWKPGQSGNPNGRPKKGEAFTDVLREHLDPVELAKRLVTLIDKGNLGAIIYAYDRADGKPGQRISLDTGLNEWIKAFEDVK